MLSPVAGLLALAGVALADDAGIIDPWPSAARSGWFPTPVAEPAAAVARAPQSALNAAQKPDAAPSVLPLATLPSDRAIVVEPWNPEPFEALPDPWVPAKRELMPAAVTSVAPHRNTDWAYAIDEIIDPWRRGTSAVSR